MKRKPKREQLLIAPLWNPIKGYEEGWGLFHTEGKLQIQRLDDPPEARPMACKCVPDPTTLSEPHRRRLACDPCRREGFLMVPPTKSPFKNDDEAVLFVFKKAQQTFDKYHRLALSLALNTDHKT